MNFYMNFFERKDEYMRWRTRQRRQNGCRSFLRKPWHVDRPLFHSLSVGEIHMTLILSLSHMWPTKIIEKFLKCPGIQRPCLAIFVETLEASTLSCSITRSHHARWYAYYTTASHPYQYHGEAHRESQASLLQRRSVRRLAIRCQTLSCVRLFSHAN